ncbi:MAG: transketolase family protein [Clostridia bacterium]|nr:transketolase family protein [Clostridia bacterium]
MTDLKEMRQALADALVKTAETDERIVVLEADLMSCHATKGFKSAYPDRFIDVGIAEQNLIGVSAGLATMGKIPFAYSFGPFATRRCYDQIFISVAYAKQPVKIVGTDPGVTAEANGGTHMPFEDMSLMRAIPKMVCFEPTDATMIETALPHIIAHNGPVYIRMPRKKQEKVYDEIKDFSLGKAIELRDGKDVTIIASGIMVSRAVEASDILKEEGISARVLNMHTWKPIDEDAIVKAVKETGALVTCENHSTNGGLGSAVAEVVVEKCPAPVEMIGVRNSFGEVGKLPYLSERFGLTTQDIVGAVRRAINRK